MSRSEKLNVIDLHYIGLKTKMDVHRYLYGDKADETPLKIDHEPIFPLKKQMSLKFFTKGIKVNDSEEQVRQYFRKIGYKVIKSVNVSRLPKDVREKLKNHKGRIDKGGMPDFYIYNDSEGFFVEVKTKADGLRVAQMEWISRYCEKFVVKIAVVYPSKINFMTFSSEGLK